MLPRSRSSIPLSAPSAPWPPFPGRPPPRPRSFLREAPSRRAWHQPPRHRAKSAWRRIAAGRAPCRTSCPAASCRTYTCAPRSRSSGRPPWQSMSPPLSNPERGSAPRSRESSGSTFLRGSTARSSRCSYPMKPCRRQSKPTPGPHSTSAPPDRSASPAPRPPPCASAATCAVWSCCRTSPCRTASARCRPSPSEFRPPAHAVPRPPPG